MSEERVSLFTDQAKYGYGTGLHANDTQENGSSVGSTKKVIFCVHGKLSGCCTVLSGVSDEEKNIGDHLNNIPQFEDHCHRDRNDEIDKKARKKLIIACVLCVIFMIIEAVGGFLSNSLAVATDAAHLLTDFASFLISLFSIWVACRPATKKMPFGWYRAEVIGALTSVLLIWVVTGILVYYAIIRLIEKKYEIDTTIMLITSAIGLLFNIIMGLTLHQHGHSHGGSSHGHSHNHGSDHSHGHEEKENINVRAAYIHVIGDFIQSVGVLIAAVVIYYDKNLAWVDPVCTFVFSILVIFTTVAIIKDVINVLMEGMPKGFDYTEIESTFMEINGVVKIHNLRVWALSLDKSALSAHLAITPGTSPQEILRNATKKIHDHYNFFEMTLQIEEFNEKMENCKQCKSLQ
ncbi:zinc transporter 2-like isoform X2 [Aphidius gifuensis]|uniref:zinc transporter 2-like isoform X2 n=1 Tax=Aphidius gifuensis TaxID=684658 RepID=UPI001CDB6DE0|nr:zinc transporter 2-like isoform X2 [Aphidius gifuensis]